MLNLTFGEQVKIVLSRKNMTIKELAETIEVRTGKKMSRQNLTQRLSRDNFQEQDMRMIADILNCSFYLSILDSAESTNAMAANLPTEEELEKLARKRKQEEILEEADTTEEMSVTERDITIGEIVDIHEELEALEDREDNIFNVLSGRAQRKETLAEAEAETEPAGDQDAEEVEAAEAVEGDHNAEEVDELKALEEEEWKAMEAEEAELRALEEAEEAELQAMLEAEEEALQEQEAADANKTESTMTEIEEPVAADTEIEEEAVEVPLDEVELSETEAEPISEEELEVELQEEPAKAVVRSAAEEPVKPVIAINPYTGREYENNSVRMHPKRIGYVQVYDRGEHKWNDMTEWAFLGYQERLKVMLGKAYEPPIYLD